MPLSAAGGDYLEALLSLTETKQPVYAVELARRLGVSRASVSRAVAGLCKNGYVVRTGKVLCLSGPGREAALLVREKQRYFEELLCEAGLPEDCARTEAYRVRHAVSPAAYAQLRAAKDRKKSAQSRNFEKTVDKA